MADEEVTFESADAGSALEYPSQVSVDILSGHGLPPRSPARPSRCSPLGAGKPSRPWATTFNPATLGESGAATVRARL